MQRHECTLFEPSTQIKKHFFNTRTTLWLKGVHSIANPANLLSKHDKQNVDEDMRASSLLVFHVNAGQTQRAEITSVS